MEKEAWHLPSSLPSLHSLPPLPFLLGAREVDGEECHQLHTICSEVLKWALPRRSREGCLTAERLPKNRPSPTLQERQQSCTLLRGTCRWWSVRQTFIWLPGGLGMSPSSSSQAISCVVTARLLVVTSGCITSGRHRWHRKKEEPNRRGRGKTMALLQQPSRSVCWGYLGHIAGSQLKRR